jgi:steroid delta-isomerase-like uncharacterized protein
MSGTENGKEASMSTHQKESVIRWFEEVWNKGRRDVIDEMLSPDFVVHEGELTTKGPEGFKIFFDRMRAAFSDIHVTPHEAVSEGEYACLRWSVTMRHTGDGLGMPATGKKLGTTGMSLIRFHNGRFAEAWQNWDMLGVMEQIKGTGPSPVYMAAS